MDDRISLILTPNSVSHVLKSDTLHETAQDHAIESITKVVSDYARALADSCAMRLCKLTSCSCRF
jgi:hypothetical protein